MSLFTYWTISKNFNIAKTISSIFQNEAQTEKDQK